MTSLLLAAPVLLSLTLLVSGLAKLGARRDTEEAMTSLRLPLRGLHRPAASALPVVEILLALALWVPSVPVQVVVAAMVALLMLAYLVIIARALTWDEQVECSCFGSIASPTVSRTTLGRNLVLTLLGLVTVAAAASGAMTEALTWTPLALAGLAAAVLLSVVLTVLTLGGAAPAGVGPTQPVDAPRPADGTDEDEELLDYERAPIPAAVLQRPDGQLITLDQLTAQQAALLVFVTEGCGPCERVLDQLPGWIADLSPVMQVQAVFSRPLDQLRERTEDRVGEHALHDLQFIARTALGATGAPSAVLLGADGLLAGGPVRGGSGVIEFVEEIQAQLRSARQDGELPVRQD